MQRDKWEFSYGADKLLDAATAKQNHHATRLQWWEKQKEEVITKIKAEGLEIDESMAAEFSNKVSSYARHTTVQVRDDLLRDLNECVNKVKEHSVKIEGYSAWIQVLASQGSASFPLNQDDWLYFFGR